MKYFILFIGILFSFSMLFSSCGHQESTPKKVALQFMTAIQQTNYKKAKEFATNDSKDMLDALASFQKMLPDESREKFAKGQISIIDADIKDSLAVVYYNSDQDTTKKSLDLKKINGKWKVAFTKEAILPNLNQPIPNQDSLPPIKGEEDIPIDSTNL